MIDSDLTMTPNNKCPGTQYRLYRARLAVCPLKTTPPLQCNSLRHVLFTLTSDYIPVKRLWGSVHCVGVTGCVGVRGGL